MSGQVVSIDTIEHAFSAKASVSHIHDISEDRIRDPEASRRVFLSYIETGSDASAWVRSYHARLMFELSGKTRVNTKCGTNLVR